MFRLWSKFTLIISEFLLKTNHPFKLINLISYTKILITQNFNIDKNLAIKLKFKHFQVLVRFFISNIK